MSKSRPRAEARAGVGQGALAAVRTHAGRDLMAAIRRESAEFEPRLHRREPVCRGHVGDAGPRPLVERVAALRPDLKVVYMTGYTRDAIVRDGAPPPGTRLMTKPFTLDDLARELADALDAPVPPRSAAGE